MPTPILGGANITGTPLAAGSPQRGIVVIDVTKRNIYKYIATGTEGGTKAISSRPRRGIMYPRAQR